MNATEIKALGSIWGAQHGLLSIRELEILMWFAKTAPGCKFLEVGHYHGLSTCALVHALQGRSDDWSLTSLDAHVADEWVTFPAAVGKYEDNRNAHFADSRLTSVYELSQTIENVDYDFVFYDGDHAAEQLRFTKVVIESDRPKLFLYDDSDFQFPQQCSQLLEESGWINLSPPILRLGGDKLEPNTQTLAVYARY